ncbi:hypothetical protein OA165_01005 [Prochlorococcus sp. AH-736-A21]|nr:hypothetical protein [Prochlorococcus sp. AH-736-A21]
MKKRTFLLGLITSLFTNGKIFSILFGVSLCIFSTNLPTSHEVYAETVLNYGLRGFKKYLDKDYLGALSDFDKAIKKEPDYGRYYALRALTKYELRDYTSALSDIDQAIFLMPNNAKFYVARGMIKGQLNDMKGACIDWKFAASMQRSDAKTLLNQYCDLKR